VRSHTFRNASARKGAPRGLVGLHTKLSRVHILSALGAAALAAACSLHAQDPVERVSTVSTKLDPGQVFEPTQYTVTLTEVDVNSAVEPPAGSYTPDTVFVDWAELGVQINQGVPSANACTLTDSNGSASAATNAHLTQCGPNAYNNSIFYENKPLAIPFTVTSPTDAVMIGLAVDNIESTSQTVSGKLQAQTWGPPNGSLSLAGTVLSTAGGIGGVALATPIGTVIAATAGFFSLANALFPPPSSGQLPLYDATSCAGGLMGNPTLAAQATCPGGFEPGIGWICPEASALPPDTMLLSLSPAQLAQIVAQGDGTLGCAPGTCNAIDFYPTMTGLLPPCGAPAPGALPCDPSQYAPWYEPFPGGGPGYDIGCSSSLHLRLTIQRNWTTGQAASSKSGDMAVYRGPGTIDAFASSPTYENQLAHDWGIGGGFNSEFEAPAEALEAAGVSVSTSPAVVSRTTANVDMFYVDSYGGLYTVYQAAPSFAWYTETLVNPGEWIGVGRVRRWLPGTAPANALVTATARTPENLDVFFIGADGNLYTTYWAQGFGTNAQGQPFWGAPFAVTEGTCVNTAAPCAGSGSPGGGVAAVARNPDRIDVFYAGKDGGIWQSSWSFTTSWVTQEIYGPSSNVQRGAALAVPGSVITATARTSMNLDVFLVGTDGGLWTSTWNGSTGGGWGTVEIPGSGGTGIHGGPISAMARQGSALDVVYESTSSALDWATLVPQRGWVVLPIPGAIGLSSSSTFGRPGVSLVASDSFSLQAFYLNGWHQLSSVAWSDPSQCDTLSSVPCSALPEDFAWTYEGVLPVP
jgi:hypothetical protein